MSDDDTNSPRFLRVERLARELRREIELGIRLGEIGPKIAFDILVRRADDQPILRGRFVLEPMTKEGKPA